MNYLYYFEITLLVVLISLIMLFFIWKNTLLSKGKKKSLFAMYGLLILCAFFDWFSVFLNEKPSSTIMLHAFAKALEYSLIPLLCIQVVNVIESDRISRWTYLLIAANAIFQLSSIGTGLSFYIDVNNVYQHGSLNWIYTAMWVFCSVYAVYKCLKYGYRFQNKNAFIPLFILSLPIIGVVLREINEEVRIEMLCICLSSIFVYIFYVDVLQKSDALTGLLNRGSYIGKTTNMTEEAVIVYFDIDQFKSYNDTYGHKYGDEILCMVGRLIKEIYSKYGLCYRVGGDEFCVILQKRLEGIKELNDRFIKELQSKNMADSQPLSVSLGYSSFNPQKDKIEDVVHLADRNMYRTKTKLQQQLKDTNRRLYATMQAFQIATQESSALVFIYDLKNQSITVDEKTAKAFGVMERQEGIPYKTAKCGIVSDETVGEYIRIHEEILSGAERANGIVELIDVEGNRLVQKLSFIAIKDEGGNSTGTAVGMYSQI